MYNHKWLFMKLLKCIFSQNIPNQQTKDKSFKIEFVTANPQRTCKSLGNPVGPRVLKEKF